MKKLHPVLTLTFVAAIVLAAHPAQAHFAWLSTDDDGHAVMWFGETTDDRTYPMPESIQAIQLHGIAGKPVATQPVDSEDFVGIQSVEKIDMGTELAGMVPYGLYHGTKLTYHVEHLPQSSPAQWPDKARADAPLQTLISLDDKGGVIVTVLRDGKPLSDTDVKLYGEDGDEEADRKTDDQGIVHFTSDEVEPGLNAVIVGYSEKAEGTLDGENHTSTTDYLTSSFKMPKSSDDDSEATEKEDSKPEPKVDPNSGASTGPANLPDVPEDLTSFGAAIADGHLYLYGGHTGSAHSYSKDEQSDRMWGLDLSQGKDSKWKKLPGGPNLQGLALVAHNGKLIRIGGFTAVNEEGEDHDLQSQATVASYDPKTQKWTDLADLPEPRSSLDAAVLGDKVYVVGGWNLQGESDQSEWHNTAWSLDLSDPSAKWQALAAPSFERRAVSVAAFDEKIYVIGGMTSDNETTTDVAIYDPAADAWSEGPELPGTGMSGFGTSAFATGGHLYVTSMDGFVNQLSDDGKSWRTIAKTDRERFFHRMVPVSDHELLMIGGASMQVGKFSQIDRIEVK